MNIALMIDWILIPSWLFAYFAVFATGEVLYHHFKVNTINCRIIVHLLCGILLAFHPISLRSFPIMEITTLGAAPFFYYMRKTGRMRSLFHRKVQTRGTILYPISVYILYRLWHFYNNDMYLYYYMPAFGFVISDMIAAIVGRYMPLGRYTLFNQTKTLSGNIAFFLTTFFGGMSFLLYYFPFVGFGTIVIAALLFSLVITVVEGISMHGWDNLTVPVMGYFTLRLIHIYILS